MPKFPMAVVLMAAGAVLTAVLPLRDWGIQTLAAVDPTSEMESAEFFSSSIKRSSYHQFVGGSRDHGGNVAGGKQLCTEKQISDQ